MLNTFVARPQGLTRIDAEAGMLPPDALWVDLIDPTQQEELLVESTDRKSVV